MKEQKESLCKEMKKNDSKEMKRQVHNMDKTALFLFITNQAQTLCRYRVGTVLIQSFHIDECRLISLR